MSDVLNYSLRYDNHELYLDDWPFELGASVEKKIKAIRRACNLQENLSLMDMMDKAKRAHTIAHSALASGNIFWNVHARETRAKLIETIDKLYKTAKENKSNGKPKSRAPRVAKGRYTLSS